MLVPRRRRCTNIKPALCQCLVFAGKHLWPYSRQSANDIMSSDQQVIEVKVMTQFGSRPCVIVDKYCRFFYSAVFISGKKPSYNIKLTFMREAHIYNCISFLSNVHYIIPIIYIYM